MALRFYRGSRRPCHHAGPCRFVDRHSLFHSGQPPAGRQRNCAAQDARAGASPYPTVDCIAGAGRAHHRRRWLVPDGERRRGVAGCRAIGPDYRGAGPALRAVDRPPRRSFIAHHHAGRGFGGGEPGSQTGPSAQVAGAAGGRCYLPVHPGSDCLAAECPRGRCGIQPRGNLLPSGHAGRRLLVRPQGRVCRSRFRDGRQL